MQTTKTRNVSLVVPKRATLANPRTARQQKPPGIDPDSGPSSANKSPKNRSQKTIDHKSRQKPASEQKGCPGKMESQLAKLQEELKEVKDQLASSESWKKRAQQENEEAKKQLAAMTARLEESQQQFLELSSSEDARVQELRKISQDRDRAWQSELEAVKKHHSMDSAALASARNEIQKLKLQLERVAESEAAHAMDADSAYAEVHSLRQELTETLSVVVNLKTQINECKDSEAQALEFVNKSKQQLSLAKSTEETLTSEGLKAMEAYKSMAAELQQSKDQVILLEGLVNKLQTNAVDESNENAEDSSGDFKVAFARESDEGEELDRVKQELDHVKCEVVQLRFALEEAERRYQEEYIRSTLQIRSAYELVERTKSEYCRHEVALEAKLKAAQADVEEFKSKLMDKESNLELNLKVLEVPSDVAESDNEIELKKFKEVSAELRASLLDKEKELVSITGENEKLKSEMMDMEIERSNMNDEALALANAARAAELETSAKLGHLTEEADKSSKKAVRVAEQLDAAQVANSELEAELRRLKVQADQWRKAAEAATALLSTDNNGKVLNKSGFLDENYNTIDGKLTSPYSDDMDDDSPKNKYGNMLKKIGVLLKKGQK